MNPKRLREKVLRQTAAMQSRVLNTLTKKQEKTERYFNKKILTLAILTIDQHVYVERRPLTLTAKDEKIWTRCKSHHRAR